MSLVSFTCCKIGLIVLNCLYLIVALLLIGIAAYGKTVVAIETFSVMGGVIACCVLLILIALAGLIGTVQHHQVLLFFYMIILFLLFFVQFALACACLALTSKQQKKLIQTSWNSFSHEQKVEMQKMFQCCGFDKACDNESLIPVCTQLKCCQAYHEALPMNEVCPSCWEAVSGSVDVMMKVIGAISLLFSFTEIVGVWLAMRYRNQKDPFANPNTFL